jgi:hypothetical protein
MWRDADGSVATGVILAPDPRDDAPMTWRIAGRYFESCNCEAICPCRRIDGVPGGRSTYGECLGVLTWLIEDGLAGDVPLAGLKVAFTTRYHDDEPGSPWRYVMYVDARADATQREALEGVFTGRFGGDALTHFPWAWKESERVAVRPVEIEVSHEPRRQWLRIRDHVTLRIRDAWAGPETVTCVIPGHDERGEELVADEVRVDDGPLAFELRGNCGYASRFDYSG